MGLLDEAIREHLELKRRHGGDASEIAKLESEVLGPVSVSPAAEQEPAVDPEPVEHVAVEPEVHHEPVAEVHHEPEPEPEPVAEEDPGQATVAFSLDELEAAEAPHAEAEPEADPGEHDELEETPEFLQETPEHDRMWFEQKPPRDFDF